MNKYILLFIFFLSMHLFAQTDNSKIAGFYTEYQNVDGVLMQRTMTNAIETGNYYQNNITPPIIFQNSVLNNSIIRWNFTDPVAIGDRNATSGTGLNEIVGWGLNSERVSLYGNTNSTPIWEYTTNPSTNINYVVISDTGGVIASCSYQKIYMFNIGSSTPIFNFDVSSLPITSPIANVVDITSKGNFIIAGTSNQVATDSNYIMGFYKDSAQPSWTIRVGQTGAGGSGVQGVKICKNDSIAMVNTYGAFYVIRTYTGQIIYQGLINPSSTAGTQSPQAISGNGNYVATINYNGYVRLYQRSGNTYNFLWQHQEPPGTYYHWMTSVDISADGQYLACGTLNFVTSSSYDGKVKLFRTTSSTPIWTYPGFGDEVQCVAFSKNGNILAASSWGDLSHQNNDLAVWRTSTGSNLPIFAVNSPGSFFWCSVSNNGSTVIGSGKAVHARQFGSGGIAYNIFIDTNDTPVGIVNSNNIPNEYQLSQNYPNPFNPSTQIDYVLAGDGNVKITVYDVMGREVAILVDRFQKQGKNSVTFDASNITSGVYFYKIESGDFKETKKMILIK